MEGSWKGGLQGDTNTGCCSQSFSPSAMKPKAWERAAGAGQKGCGCFADGGGTDTQEILQSPAEMGVADMRHAGGMASARMWGEEDLGNPNVLSSLL